MQGVRKLHVVSLACARSVGRDKELTFSANESAPPHHTTHSHKQALNHWPRPGVGVEFFEVAH